MRAVALAALLLAACADAPPARRAESAPETTRSALCPEAEPPDGGTDVEFDGVEDWASAKTARLFDNRVLPRRFRIEVAPEDWEWLKGHAREEQYVDATVEHEGERFGGASVRFKGGYGSLFACFDEDGRQICDKLSLKVSFNERTAGGRFQGVRKLAFNSCNRDKTCLRERLSYELYRDVGLPASRAVHALVSVNDGPESLYLLVEHIDKEWIEDRFAEPEGNLYKEVWPQHLSDEPYRDALRTNKDAGDVSRMVELARILADVTEAGFDEALEPWIDTEAMLRYFVVDQVIHNWDGIWKFYCGRWGCGNHNYYVYDDPQSKRLHILPWDLDHTFNRPNTDMARSWWDVDDEACEVEVVDSRFRIRAPQCDPLLRGLMLLHWDAWRELLEELTQGDDAPLSAAAQLRRLDRYRSMIHTAVEGDPLGPDAREWRAAVAQLRQVIRAQAVEIRRFLSGG